MIDWFFDFETRSHVNLKDSGSVVYALHPSTEATLLTWAFGRTTPVKCWRRGQPIPQEIIDVALHPEKYHFVAHNIMFDYLIWTQVFSKLIPGLVNPKIENLTDNMALTSHFRVGAGLDAAAKMLNLPYSKDKAGRLLMLKQCKPKANGQWHELTEVEWNTFAHYGVIDTKLLRDIYYMIPPLPAAERWAWEWTFKRNLRGLRLDMELVHELNDIVDTAIPVYVKEFEHLTGYQVKINSPTKCRDYFKQYYPHIEDMQADTLRDLLADKRPVPPHVRRALEIKDLAGSTSIAKIKTAIRQNHSGRIYGILAYAHAQTKRWAGRGIQVQNFPRVDDKRPDAINFELDTHDLVSEVRSRRSQLKDPIGFSKNLLRRIFVPDPGKYFYCGDWSKIEPTVLFWLTGQGNIPGNWYEDMAATIYSVDVKTVGKDSVERQIGKNAALGCGYGMGKVKFKDQVLKQTGLEISDSLSGQAVFAYRKKYEKVTQFWKDIQWAFGHAINGQATRLCDGKIFVMPMEHPFKGVRIRLPSGSYLYYHNAQFTPPYSEIVMDENGVEREVWHQAGIGYMSDEDGSPRLKRIYGGLLTEHVTSCTARDIILPAVYNLEQADFEVLNLVHDELWGQGEPGRDEEYERIMCINPSWAPDLRISAGMKNGIRYLK